MLDTEEKNAGETPSAISQIVLKSSKNVPPKPPKAVIQPYQSIGSLNQPVAVPISYGNVNMLGQVFWRYYDIRKQNRIDDERRWWRRFFG